MIVRRDSRAEVVLVQAGVEVTSWPLWVEHGVELSVVDRLVRLQLAAARTGCSIRLRHTCPQLLALLELTGLAELLLEDPGAADHTARSR